MINYEVRKLKVHSDERGWLAEILREEHLDEKKFGQIYVTTINPGMSKANHYHTRKTDWFCLMKGKIKLVLCDLDGKEKKELIVDGDNLVVVKVPPKIVHGIKNVGDDVAYLLCYVDEPYDPDDPDTFVKKVI